MVQIPPGKQEKRQHHRRIEIGFLAGIERLEQRDRGRQDQRKADRHIHPQPPDPQAGPGAFEKRLAREHHRRQGNRRRNPVEHVARRRFRPRPHRHRQQHDIHHAESRHPQPHQQIAALTVGFRGRQKARVQLMRLIAKALQRRDHRIGAHIGICLYRHPLHRQVHPHRPHTRQLRQPGFHGRDTGRAMRRRNGQHQPRFMRGRKFRQPFRRRGHRTGRASRRRRMPRLPRRIKGLHRRNPGGYRHRLSPLRTDQYAA